MYVSELYASLLIWKNKSFNILNYIVTLNIIYECLAFTWKCVERKTGQAYQNSHSNEFTVSTERVLLAATEIAKKKEKK